MHCAECLLLVEKYSDAATDFFAATAHLSEQTGDGFRKALEASADAKAKCKAARLALYAHKAQHQETGPTHK